MGSHMKRSYMKRSPPSVPVVNATTDLLTGPIDEHQHHAGEHKKEDEFAFVKLDL